MTWDAVVDEVQELVVATSDMPVEDWRRTYRLVYLAGAAYNQRVLRVVVQLVRPLGGDSAACVGRLGEAAGHALAPTVLAEVDSVVERYLDSILAGGAFTLPGPHTGACPLAIEDAVAAACLARPDAFLAEAQEQVARFLDAAGLPGELLDEVFRFQALITPRAGRAAPVQATFEHGWAGFASSGAVAPPQAGPVLVRFTPPAFARIDDPELFLTT